MTVEPVFTPTLDELAAVLPSGRTAPAVPDAAAVLLQQAVDAGWRTHIYWAEASGGAPFLTVEAAILQPSVYFKITWHSFRVEHGLSHEQIETGDVSGLRLRLFGKLVKRDGRAMDAPSLKRIAEEFQTTTVVTR